MFSAWAGEIAGELQEARQALAVATEELQAAEMARDVAVAQQRATQAAIMLADLRQPLAFALALRVQVSGEDAHAAAGVVGRCRSQVAAALARIADHEEGLDQLARILAPETADQEATNAEAG
jgi:hypothetical protein